jgi:hypothetical protein
MDPYSKEPLASVALFSDSGLLNSSATADPTHPSITTSAEARSALATALHEKRGKSLAGMNSNHWVAGCSHASPSPAFGHCSPANQPVAFIDGIPSAMMLTALSLTGWRKRRLKEANQVAAATRARCRQRVISHV